MRGSHLEEVDGLRDLGIIPAHAGLTPSSPQMAAVPWDHPRACGAHLLALKKVQPPVGSSPRMRGSLRGQVPLANCQGIIPAHAGLTRPLWMHQTARRDHPRACGAHRTTGDFDIYWTGSSPRMRGSHRCHYRRLEDVGIIPAHAGLTLKNPNIDAILSGPHPVFYSFLRVIR